MVAHPAFVRATVVNFFFFAGLNFFVLLPLYIKAHGGTEVEVGLPFSASVSPRRRAESSPCGDAVLSCRPFYTGVVLTQMAGPAASSAGSARAILSGGRFGGGR